MASLNKVMLIGRLGQDPEKRVTTQGHSVVNFSLATEEYVKDGDNRVEWHRCVAWNKLADNISDYTKKGSQIFIEGSLQTREWQDKEGNKRYTTEINIRNMQFLDSKNSGHQNNQSQHPANQPPDFIDDDIPFS